MTTSPNFRRTSRVARAARRFLRCALPSVLPLSLASTTGAQAPRDADAWRADLAYADSAIRAVHPAPFHRVPTDSFAAVFSALAREVPRTDDLRIALRLKAIVALLHDGHSRLQVGAPLLAGDRAFPVRLERFVDGIHVVATRPADTALLGARVERIGALGATAAWDSLMVLADGDNAFSRMTAIPRMLAQPPLLAALGIARQDSLVLDVMRRDGRRLRAALPAATDGGGAGWAFTGMQGPGGATATLPAGTGTRELVERHRALPYWFTVSDGMLYVQVNQVVDARDSVLAGDDRAVLSLAAFTERVFARFDAGGVSRLVLDLRFNGGGNNALVRPFVAAAAARPALAARGRFFVITGRATYSAAMNFTSLLEDRTGALFVGEPPGGAPRHYGDAVALTLPRSGLVLRLSTLRWDAGVAPTDLREVMEPDLPAPPRFADLARGVDAPLEAIARHADGGTLAERLVTAYRADGLAAAMAAYDSARAARPEAERTGPWSSDVQALVEFAYGTIPVARARADVFGAFAFVTERHPESPVAWAERARVAAFVNEWGAARDAYARALALRPANDLLRRWQAVAARR